MRVLSLALALMIAPTLLAAPPDGYLRDSTLGLTGPVNSLASPVPVVGKETSLSGSLPSTVTIPQNLSVPEVEAKLALALNNVFRQPRFLAVRAIPDPGHSPSTGRFAQVTVEFSEGRLDALPVAKAQLTVQPAVIDLSTLFLQGNLQLVGQSMATGRFVVNQAGINEVLSLRQKNLSIEEPRVEIRDGRVHLSAHFRTMLVRGWISTAGRFEIRERTQVFFQPQSLKVGSVQLPKGAITAIARRVNPVFDMSRLKRWRGLAFLLSSIQIEDDNMVLECGGSPGLGPYAVR